jgi:hypothetical protein
MYVVTVPVVTLLVEVPPPSPPPQLMRKAMDVKIRGRRSAMRTRENTLSIDFLVFILILLSRVELYAYSSSGLFRMPHRGDRGEKIQRPGCDHAVFRDRKNIPHPDNRDFAWPQYDERMR